MQIVSCCAADAYETVDIRGSLKLGECLWVDAATICEVHVENNTFAGFPSNRLFGRRKLRL